MSSLTSALFFESAEEVFRRVHREIKPRTPVPPLAVEYKAFANADSHVRLENGRIEVKITDLLAQAPPHVTEALAHILLGKLYRKPAAPQYDHRYRLYLNRKDVRHKIDESRRTRGRKHHLPAQGEVHNLEEIFESLNQTHFGGMMVRPALGWSHVRSRTRLGHFDPSHGMIIISRLFDDPKAPKLALEYVMYHEMLHLHYPVLHTGTRRCVHSKDFKAHEKQFPQFEEAKKLLKKMW